ncbi:beta-lactamase-like protein [Cytidiella melzeri]|nr:beta-lactamase-like protein [Cytidiella melzeri]
MLSCLRGSRNFRQTEVLRCSKSPTLPRPTATHELRRVYRIVRHYHRHQLSIMPRKNNNFVVTFLGTTSGGGPTETRNCSSLVLDAAGDGSLWMVDCAEGTVRQFAQQPFTSFQRLRMSDVNRIFITHMHADHSIGLITLLRNVLGFAPDAQVQPSSATSSTSAQWTKPPLLKVEIYGPVGVRAFVRTVLTLTHTRSADRYCVHELLMPGETPSASGDVQEEWHESEVGGRDIPCGEDGFWREIVVHERMGGTPVVINAGPIVHRDPCIGYVFSEQAEPPPLPTPSDDEDGVVPEYKASDSDVPRTVVILGDTSDPSALVPLIAENSEQTVSLLVHEATDAYIPTHIDTRGTTGRNRTHESVKAKAIAKGHSTPAMAGAFARLIGAERLALNHIGARFPAPFARAGPDNFRQRCMLEIENQAMREWKPTNGIRAMAVSDFDRIVIPPIKRQTLEVPAVMVGQNEYERVWNTIESTSAAGMQEAVQPMANQPRGFRGGRARGTGRGGHGQHSHANPRHGHQLSSTAGEESNRSSRKRENSGGNDKASARGSALNQHKGDCSTSTSKGKKPRRDGS